MMHSDMKLPDAGLRFKLLDGTQMTDDAQKPFSTFSNDLNFDVNNRFNADFILLL